MAKFESTMFNAIRGSLAGTTFFTTPSGAIIGRAKTIPVNPNTPRQNLIRTSFADAVGAWKVLTQDQRDAWDAYAQLTYSPVKGRQTFIGNYGLALYCQLISVGVVTPGTLAPLLPGVLPMGSIVVGAPAGPVATGISVNIENPNADDIAALIEISLPFDQSRERFKGPFDSKSSQVVTLTALANTTTDFLELVVGARYFVRVRGITDVEPMVISTEFFTNGIAVAIP